jgi:hypothetical protein
MEFSFWSARFVLLFLSSNSRCEFRPDKENGRALRGVAAVKVT